MNKKRLAYFRLMRLDKPIGNLLLLWPTLWGLLLTGQATLSLVIIFVLGVLVMRAAGCVINDYADRHFDEAVKRTEHRPLATGELSPKNALITFSALIVVAFILLLMLPPLAWFIAVLALLSTLIYPFLKRYTHLPQVMLGIAFSWGIPMAYAATISEFPLTCWLLVFANICWTIAYDTQYAMVDRDDDLTIGIKSTAILFGRYDKLIIGILQIITLIVLSVIGLINNYAWVYRVSLILAFFFFIYQQWLIKDRERANCFRAFLNNNWVGFILFLGILMQGM